MIIGKYLCVSGVLGKASYFYHLYTRYVFGSDGNTWEFRLLKNYDLWLGFRGPSLTSQGRS